MVVPGSVIPKWFRHQSIGAEVNIIEPSSHLCIDEWVGTAVCVVFCSCPSQQINDVLLVCLLIVNGKEIYLANIGAKNAGLSDNIGLYYFLNQYYEEVTEILKECEATKFSQIGIKIERNPLLKVKKCGFRIVYKKDIEDLTQTMAQSSNINIIPYEDLGVLHHNFDNSAKQTCNDYDGVGPSGEGSSNDCEDYFECEEHND